MKGLLRIMSVSYRQWQWMAAGIVLGVLVIGANTLLMALSGWFIASMAVAGSTGVQFNYFLPSAAIRLFAVVRTAGRYIERLVTHEAAFRVLADLRVWLFQRIVPLAPAGLERYAAGDAAGRLRADIDALESLYLRIFAPLAVGVVSILLAVTFVGVWDSLSALLLFGFLITAGGLLPFLARRLALAPGKRSAELAGELRVMVTEGIQGAEELVLLGATRRQAEQVDDLSGRLVACQKRLLLINGLTMSGTVACSGIGVAAILLAGSISVSSGNLAGEAMVMLVMFAAASFEATAGLPSAMQHLPAATESVRRIHELADADPPVFAPQIPLPPTAATDIRFRNVRFSYDQLPVLSEFCLEIPQGTCTALVGPSGSGKSTVAEILLRFREYEGSVAIGGVEIRDMAESDLHRILAALTQYPHLFNTSIRENIMLGNREADDDQLQRALYCAGLDAWIESLPQGLDTAVGEGGSAVSGGEARRIALARTLLKDAPILVLDEPTEGLDAGTEQEVVSRLVGFVKGRTVLLITHRPACMTMAEKVVEMPGIND